MHGSSAPVSPLVVADDSRTTVRVPEFALQKAGYPTVTAAVRADASLDPQPYIIMVTAEGRGDDRTRALDAGVDDFLWKPLSPSDLLAEVRAGLGG